MSVVTIIWSMIASACLTLAIIYLVVWFRHRAAWAYLFFSLTALATTGLAFCELWRMRVTTPAEMLTVMTVIHVPLFVWLVSVTWFVYFYLGAGRLWLAWTICAIRAFSLIGNLLLGQDPGFRPITRLEQITFLGESVTVLSGVPNPLTPITQFATLLVMLFVADAMVTAWRRGDRRKALMVGGSVEFFLLIALGQATLAVWAGVRIPVTYCVPYLGLIAVMGYELSREVLRASQLVAELRDSDLRISMLRDQIAHVGRVSMLGQLASALAHEINQPLGAILRNAEAAELFLAHPSPDLVEIRAILRDIRRDDQRAGAVIDRMRGLLKWHSLDARTLDVRELLEEVAALVRADAQARQVKVLVEAPHDLPLIHGDRIHLQQVLLNLLLNGMDALGETPLADRRVQVSARLNEVGAIELAVADAGHGIAVDNLPLVFEPFFTTKPAGMGMGLPISRTIVEAHGGRLWAENVAGGGATFRFTLPVAREEAA